MEKTDIDPLGQSVVDTFMKTMQGAIRGGEEAMPQIILIGREVDDPVIIPVLGFEALFGSKEGKRQIRPIIKKIWQNFSAQHSRCKLLAVIVFSDSWVEETSTAEWEKMGRKRDGSSLADKPGMGEAIIAQCSLADRDITYSWPYVRGEKEIVFAPAPTIMEGPSNSRALLMGLWPL